MFGKKYRYNRKGLWLSYDSQPRKALIWVNAWWWFDAFIIVCIVLNSISLASYDYSVRQYGHSGKSEYNDNIEVIGEVFSYIFIVEAAVKTVA
jgi:hypothetical protein